MTIDIEKLINDIDEDGSGEIEYDEFRNLLSSSDWNVGIKSTVYSRSWLSWSHYPFNVHHGIYNVPTSVFSYIGENKFPHSNYSN